MMRALVYHGPGQLAIEEREVRPPGEGEALLRIAYSAICGSDVGAYLHASDRFKPPLILGHEYSAVVEAVGPGVDSVKPGSRVCGNPPIYCGKCWYCKHGRYNICPDRSSLGNSVGRERCNGSFAEYITLPAFTLVPLRDEVSLLHGALMEPLSVGLHAASNGHRSHDETVAVLGTGPIGLMTILGLKGIGVSEIIATDLSEARLDIAKKCGASHALISEPGHDAQRVRDLTDGLGADRVIICSGSPDTFHDAIAMTRNGGAVVLVGMIQSTLEFCPMEIFSRDIDLLSSYTFTDEIYSAVEMTADGRVDLAPLISSVYPLENARAAFESITAPASREIKVLIDMGAGYR